jgi:hypothetical protein
MSMAAFEWTAQEYKASEPTRVTIDALQTDEFYYVGMLNHGSGPEAFRAIAKVETLHRSVGKVALSVQYYSRDLQPSRSKAQPGTLPDNFWTPDSVLKLNYSNGDQGRIKQGYFLPYEDEFDKELRTVFDSLLVPTAR